MGSGGQNRKPTHSHLPTPKGQSKYANCQQLSTKCSKFYPPISLLQIFIFFK